VAPGPERNLLAAVRGYAADAIGCSQDLVAAVHRFDGGNRHAVHKVSFSGGDGPDAVVVRVSYGTAAADRVQAAQEAKVLARVGGRAAPLLYDFRPISHWFEAPAMCLQFVSGREMDLDAATPLELEQLGSVVAWVHDRHTADLVDGPSVATDIASYAQDRLRSILATAAWIRDPLAAPIQADLRHAVESVQRRLLAQLDASSFIPGEALALLHGDIGPENVLWGPDPVLIDWEYARLGDPADEIAYTSDQNGLTPAQREAFWRGYRQGARADARLAEIADRVSWWEPLTLLGSTLWWVQRWVRGSDADAAGTHDPEVPRELDYYLDHVRHRLNRLNNLVL
jgi:Ser/Thr protein kinase RdoA (MazF antagonist)